ncbi:hypothetical protein JOD54_004171 [Actinokineospora baliensis]|uniref:hypothetical protein n=1 Tax=Actinokineospora baliensis TaxID=547056 RepID=UPI00195AC009|nr:hypothetical protein [Actinokineospora baliensis]MBM7773967.1 hypothetical protein [Actinokineospora baliensis]
MSPLDEVTRSSVERIWQGVVDGSVSREEAHAWAEPWVEGDSGSGDVMTDSGLQHLHGFDLVWVDDDRTITQHGGIGPRVHSAADIERAFTAWQAACDSYDADPVGYVRQVQASALANLLGDLREHGREAE